jgi:hypothetical protein
MPSTDRRAAGASRGRGPCRLRVASPRNSRCGARLSDLDWSRWWTDALPGLNYLKVAHGDGETVHRVFCRRAETPRLAMEAGELYWLIDPPRPETEGATDADSH